MEQVELDELQVGDRIRVSGILPSVRTSFNLSNNADTWASLLHVALCDISFIKPEEEFSFEIELATETRFIVYFRERSRTFKLHGVKKTTETRFMSVNQQFFSGEWPEEISILKKTGEQTVIFSTRRYSKSARNVAS